MPCSHHVTLPTREGNVKHAWRVRRELQGSPDGQRRWDRAYQLLLEWTATDGQLPSVAQGEVEAQEGKHESGDLRAGVNPAPGTAADH